MNRRLVLALAIVLALGGAAYWLTRGDERGSFSAPGAPASAPGESVAHTNPEDDPRLLESYEQRAAEENAPQSAAAPAPPESLVRGRVVDGRWRAIAGAVVAIDYRPADDFNFGDLAYSQQEIAVGETRTDTERAFELAVPPDWPVRVHARADGFSRAMLTDIFAGADLTIVLGPSATLLGRITRALDGSPVEGAEVRLFRMGGPTYTTVESDADGNYRLADVPPGLATLDIGTSWLADPQWTSIDLPAGARVVHDVALQDGAAVFGIVSDARTGAPIANAEVGAGWFFSHAVRSSATGEYELLGFGTPGVNEIFVRAQGYADARHEFPWTRMPSERTRLDFALDPAHRARGRVVEPTGLPVEGVYVAAVSAGGGSGTRDWKSTCTDADGRFVLDSLHPTHQHGLVLRATGWANLAYAFPHTEREIEDLDLGTFTLQRAGSLSGVVVDEQDEIVADVEVAMRGQNADSGVLLGGVYRPTLPDNLESRSVRTDQAGRFRFGDLAAGDYGFSVSRRTGTPARQPPVTLALGEQRTNLRFVLPSAGTIRGRVETADSLPVAGAEVHAKAEGQSEDSSPYLRARCESGGRFVIEGLEAELYTLRVERGWLDPKHAQDCASTQMRGVRPGDEVVITLARGVPLEGRVLTAENRPGEGTWVCATLDGLYLDSAYCDASGRFRLLVPDGALPQLDVYPTVRSDDWNGWTILHGAGGASFMNVPVGSEEFEFQLPAR